MCGNKSVFTFSIILILEGVMTFESQRVHAFCRTKKETLIKTERIENGKSHSKF